LTLFHVSVKIYRPRQVILRQNLAGAQVLDLSAMIDYFQFDDHSATPPASLLPFLSGGHRPLALENLALRQ
jgi:hypothetical protein